MFQLKIIFDQNSLFLETKRGSQMLKRQISKNNLLQQTALIFFPVNLFSDYNSIVKFKTHEDEIETRKGRSIIVGDCFIW
jgi:hypothetical protein